MSKIKISEEKKQKAMAKHLIEQEKIHSNWNPLTIFNNKIQNTKTYKKVVIEIGSGNGSFLIETAEQNSDTFHIGIEIKRKRINKCVIKSYKKNLDNIGFIYGDAKIILLNKKILESSADEILLTFPDPWPKNKHRKNRIVNNEFIEVIYKSLKNKGKFIIATDHKEYLDEMIESIDYFGKFDYEFDSKTVNTLPNFTESYFERLWRNKGKTIYYCVLIK